jgi:hypothetical protein
MRRIAGIPATYPQNMLGACNLLLYQREKPRPDSRGALRHSVVDQLMMSRSQIELAEADRRIAEADRNIRQLGSLIPQLTMQGYATAEMEGQLDLMTQVLHNLRLQRRSIVATLEGEGLPHPPVRRLQALPKAPRAAADLGFNPWRALKRLGGVR